MLAHILFKFLIFLMGRNFLLQKVEYKNRQKHRDSHNTFFGCKKLHMNLDLALPIHYDKVIFQKVSLL